MSDKPVSQELSEQVFDYFVREMISQQAPPDLTQRIAAAWAQENQFSPVNSEAQSDPLANCQTAFPAPIVTVVAKPIRAPRLTLLPTHANAPATGLPTDARPNQARRNALAALLALGACGLLAWLGTLLLNQDRISLADLMNLSQSVREAALGPHGEQVPPDTHLPQAELGKSGDGPPSLGANSAIPLDINDVPFQLDRRVADGGDIAASAGTHSSATQPDVATHDWMRAIADQTVIEGHQIVRHIDQQLALAWQQAEVEPADRIPAEELAQRISQVLTGEPAPPNVSAKLDTLVSQATASLPFARRWADQFVTQWFAGQPLSADDQALQGLKQHFASQIYGDYPWNLAAAELLGSAQTSLDGQSNAETFLGALAGNGNHRLISRLGASFLDANLNCVRCHKANLGATESPASVPPQAPTSSPAQFALQQPVYWSLAALLQGIDVHNGQDGRRQVVDRQSQQLASGEPLIAYYELLDGRLQVAQPVLPDGQPWTALTPARVPRQALAQWLSQSPAVDAATVNQVWQMVFGSPLVAQGVGAGGAETETTGGEQRRALQLYLAGQYRAHHHDLKQLVGWIVRSDAFSRQRIQPTQSQWLDASQSQLRAWSLAEANFAGGPHAQNTTPAPSLEATLLATLQARERQAASEQVPTLAQPNPELAAAATAVQVDNQPSAVPAEASAQRASLSPEELRLIERLLQSRRLSWENRVEHVVWLEPQNVLDARIVHLADELLRLRSGDAHAALLDLLAAVRGTMSE